MYTPTTPEQLILNLPLPSGDYVHVPVTIDTYQIEGFQFFHDVQDSNASRLHVQWSKGYTVSGKYTAVSRTESRFGGATVNPVDGSPVQGAGSAAALALIMGATVPTGTSYYEAIRNALWLALMQVEAIPPGTVL